MRYTVGLCLLLVLLVGLVSVSFREGEKVGAKIALSDGYRLAEVRGSCDTLFRSDECVRCH